MADQLTEEERVRQLIAERKAQKAKEEEQAEIQKEKQRREDGKNIQASAQQLKEIREKLEQEEAKKQKDKDLLYQKQLKEQIKKEREERALQFAKPSPPPSVESEPSTPSTTTPQPPKSNSSVLRIRLFNGQTTDETCDVDSTLSQVKDTIATKHNLTTKSFHFRQTYPNKIFDDVSEKQSLRDLGLYPNATLVVTSNNPALLNPTPSQAPQTGGGLGDYITATSNYLYSWVTWFAGTAPPAPSNEPQDPFPSQKNRGKVHHVSSVSEYNKLKDTHDLVIVDISATWCGPCKKIAPYFEDLATKHKSVVFIHVDLDQFKNSLSDLKGINSVPTFLYFKNKHLVTTVKGANSSAIHDNLLKYK